MLVVFSIFVVQSAACRKPAADNLIGTWQVDYRNSELTLTLNQDGTFEQVFEKKGESKAIRRKGKWELTELEGPSVLLNGALLVEDQTGDIDSKLSVNNNAGWVLHMNETFGHVTLTVNEDLGLYFEKIHQK